MMPGWGETLAAALVAATGFTVIGLPLARRIAPAGVSPLGLAPALGWAVCGAAALPVLSVAGFGAAPVLAAIAIVLAAIGLRRGIGGAQAPLPLWAILLAACVAFLPLMAIMPKAGGGGVLLGPPLFDHVKIALVDGIVREGLPVRNPFLGAAAGHKLAYYYLWHFTAACLARTLHIGGWAADAAMTGCTAWASLMLVMALAQAFGREAYVACAASLLALPASLRPVLDAVLGHDASGHLLLRDGDVAGWLDQAAWVPQHLASASCAVVAILLIQALAGARPALAALLLGLAVAAGFESSTWIGGVAFAAAAPAAGFVVLLRLPRDARLPFVAWAAAAAVIAAALVAPFMVAQLAAVSGRGGAAPVAFGPYRVMGTSVTEAWRTALDVPAFWILLLPIGLPAVFPLALPAMLRALRPIRPDGPDAPPALAAPLAVFALTCLAVAWLFRSTIDNNDLGWRAVLPAILVLTAFAASEAVRLTASRRWAPLAACLALGAFGLPGTAILAGGFASGQRPGDGAAFARAAPAWEAVRRIAGPHDRVLGNPAAAALATPWPVNIGWALLSDRPSCYSQWETVLAYGSIPRARLDDMEARMLRVFGGHAVPGDTATLAWDYGCQVVLVQPGYGAWPSDAFATSAEYGLADERQGQWRIYVRKPRAPR